MIIKVMLCNHLIGYYVNYNFSLFGYTQRNTTRYLLLDSLSHFWAIKFRSKFQSSWKLFGFELRKDWNLELRFTSAFSCNCIFLDFAFLQRLLNLLLFFFSLVGFSANHKKSLISHRSILKQNLFSIVNKSYKLFKWSI